MKIPATQRTTAPDTAAYRDDVEALGLGERATFPFPGSDTSSPEPLRQSSSIPCATVAPSAQPVRTGVSFHDLTHSEKARAKVIARRDAVLEYRRLVASGTGKELALQAVCSGFADRMDTISPRSLRRWDIAYTERGEDGLVEQKLGRVGAKPVANHLPDAMVQRGKALAAEHGSVAKAARILAADPDLPYAVKAHLHGAHQSKSYVTPSIVKALTPGKATLDFLQGNRTANLAGRFTPGDYSDLFAGDWFTSDDMTSNVYCWTDDDTDPKGWRIAQAQILPVLDIGSLRWINVRVIVRAGGQYSSDDIWGTFGDTFDTVGLPRVGFLLEGGHWQANRVLGHRTGLSDDDRAGGLSSLGLKVQRSRLPRSKHIEERFNQFQYWADAAPGYAGRDQRKQMPERLKAQLAECQSGRAHPSQYILSQAQLTDAIMDRMRGMNAERNDGKILRGLCPDEKWAQDTASRPLTHLPESAAWLYRSNMSPVKVTKAGIRVAQGSGKKLVVHYYDNPELIHPIVGRTVLVYWNPHRPEAAAAILDGISRKFLGMAFYVQPVARMSASPEALRAEAQRKGAAINFARTEARAMAPHLQRGTLTPAPMGVSPGTLRTGEEIAAANAAALQAEDERRAHQRQIARAARDNRAEDIGAIFSTAAEQRPVASQTAEELDMVCGESPQRVHELLIETSSSSFDALFTSPRSRAQAEPDQLSPEELMEMLAHD